MECNHEVETQVVHVAAFLRSELGYGVESPGAVQRELLEHSQMIASIDDALRGRGDELGLIGWMMVLRRTWIAMATLLGMAAGYFANDLVDAIGARQHHERAAKVAGALRAS
jgi:hypothetical protein